MADHKHGGRDSDYGADRKAGNGKSSLPEETVKNVSTERAELGKGNKDTDSNSHYR